MSDTTAQGTTDRLRRWRMILGGDEADGVGATLNARDAAMDRCLAALYEAGDGGSDRKPRGKRGGGLGASSPNVARWLGDVRSFFPSSVVRVMQQDAMERLGPAPMPLA